MPIGHLKLIAKIEPLSSRLIGKVEKKLATPFRITPSQADRQNRAIEFEADWKGLKKSWQRLLREGHLTWLD
jgi:hypothetical protein